MIKKYLNTNVLTACEMLEVSDESILEWSNGEVKGFDYLDEVPVSVSAAHEGSLFDEKIFGKLSECNLNMGHISLPRPVVNPQYIRGKKPILPSLLGLSRKQTEDICNHILCYNKKTKELSSLVNISNEERKDYLTGGEAIEKMLREKGVSSQYIVLHNLLVLPVSLRVVFNEDGELDHCYSIQYLYKRVLSRKNRLLKLEEFKAPDIILINERRMLEIEASCLIANGAFEYLVIGTDGIPCVSLDDAAEAIKNPFIKSVHYDLEKLINKSHLDTVKEAVNKCLQAHADMSKWNNGEYNDFTEENSDKISDDKFNSIQNRINESLKVVIEECEGTVDNIFNEYFTSCSDYKAEFKIVAMNAIGKYLDEFMDYECPCIENDENNKNDNYTVCPLELMNDIVRIAYENMNNLKKKRIQWIPYDTYELRTTKE